MKVAGSNVAIENVALPELLVLAFKVRPSQMKTPSWNRPGLLAEPVTVFRDDPY